MNYTVLDLLGSSVAVLAFASLVLPVGFLAARLVCSRLAADLTVTPGLPGATFFWSVALGTPGALALAAIAGRFLPAPLLSWLFVGLACVAAGIWVLTLPRGSDPGRRTSSLSYALWAALLGLSIYLLLASTSFQSGSHLYEPVSAADWSVRVPLVASSLQNGVPPRNPFFTAAGVEQPARYYFFWYSLCAQAARLAHLPARAALAGSTVWSALALVSLLFLVLRYLAGIEQRLTRHCLLALALCCVLGVDILPTLAGLLTHPIHLTPEIEWWHDDRIPSFLGAFVFAPHHIAGLVCAVLGILLLTLLPFRMPQPNRRLQPARRLPPALFRVLLGSCLAGICFAATAGASTYLALCFASVGVVFGLMLLLERRWMDTLALLGAGILAALLALPFLHSLLAAQTAPVPAAGPAHAHLLRFTLRDLQDGDRAVTFFSKRLHHRITSRPLLHLLALPVVAVSLPLEFGFFVVPLALKLRQDLRRLRARDRFSDGERALWAIFLGALLPAVFLSSEPTQGVNDLGRHAGLLLRFVAVVWSTPLLLPYADRLLRREPLLARTAGRPAVWTLRLAVVLLGLGLCSEAWQVLADRFYLVVFDRTHRNPEMPFAKDADLAARYLDLRRGLDQVEAGLPAAAVVQSNMGSRFQLPVMLYSHRPFAAGDPSCEIAFGGDPALCAPMVRQLQQLFGGPADMQPVPLGPYVTVFAPDAGRTTTPAAFSEACHDLRLSAVVAQNSDPAWSVPGSWVWTETPRFATPRIRIFLCPAPPRA